MRALSGLLLVGLLMPCLIPAQAEENGKERHKDKDQEVDTEFIFGFTEGADIGELGEKELEHATIARLGKRDGSYGALSGQLIYETVPFANFRFEIGAPLALHAISGVSGLDDRQQLAFDGLFTEMRYRLLDREHAPFALTVGIAPHWSRVEETSGAPVDNYGGEIAVALDRELIKNKLFGALNFVYDPEVTRMRANGSWQREATFGLSAAVTAQLRPGIFFGAEARYLRKYDALVPDPFAGEALFLGPTMFVRFSKTLAIASSFGTQVAGRAAGDAGALDLTNFTHHQALFRLQYNF
jgi:hypothetical protein